MNLNVKHQITFDASGASDVRMTVQWPRETTRTEARRRASEVAEVVLPLMPKGTRVEVVEYVEQLVVLDADSGAADGV